MNSPIATALEKFLHIHNTGSKPVLLAYSGGPDSQALFHALLNYAKKHSFSFAVAHVDHGWRKESAAEAALLAKKVQDAGIVFHERMLDPTLLKGNLEQACRDERYKFFCALAISHGYQAVLTAHHRNDVAETVLKRVFEGNSLASLIGMEEVAKIHGVIVWRPLLGVPKSDILEYVEKHHLEVLNDSTNVDERFLRARMRVSLLPSLAETFGKEIASGLCHISRESSEIHDYLEKNVAIAFNDFVEGPFGVMWDLSKYPMHKVEVKFLFKKICKAFGAEVSRDAIDIAADLLLSGKANKNLEFTTFNVCIDRSRVFCVRKNEFQSRDLVVTLAPGQTVRWGPWLVHATPCGKEGQQRCSWKDLWQGSGQIVVPVDEYVLKTPVVTALYPGTHSVSKWWTDHKVPAFLRNMAPLLFQGDKVACELLTDHTDVCPQDHATMAISFTV